MNIECPQCDTVNDTTADRCYSCGAVLRPLTGHEAQQALYKAFVGPKNEDYYVAEFINFDEQGRAGISWNWAAFLVSMYWLLYRKMWLWAGIAMIVPTLLVTLGLLILVMLNQTAGIAVLVAVVLALGFVPPLIANALYYRHCRNTIAAVQARQPDYLLQLEELEQRGGVASKGILALGILVAVIVPRLVQAVVTPAYDNINGRASVDIALEYEQEAASAIGKYYRQHHEVPPSLAAAGFDAQPPEDVSDLHLDTANGQLELRFGIGGRLTGTRLLLSPTANARYEVSWRCLSPDIPRKMLPPECR